MKFPTLEAALLEDFKFYKETGKLPDYFGRDTAYERPDDIQDSGLWHIHLSLDNDKFKAQASGKQDQKTIQWNRTSDTALVYARGLLDENSYSLIAVFTPPAHSKAQNYERMRILAEYARTFSHRI
ncbi:type II toxin-antitoxin system YafO family toxin [Kluyvera ascorbata]|uniref:type II toxin-antitoxin system YafO family toxin n=1 Tax=Kluyvera ascorbata TaxID=51288 RepID=UPI001FECB7F1|nr:type II toxin-antitoxin system YafO family toxin [Kluyvera ascorbata]